ncbi:glycerate kinase type-2 family protein, partial [Kaarinaea lacus]
VITKHGHCSPGLPGVHVIEAGHPLPDQKSLEAGSQLQSYLNTAPANARFLFLISGGASALVEVLPESVSLKNLEKLNNWLLQSGLPIAEMNAIRQQVSCIKGGRLARHTDGRTTTVLLMSDVQGDNPAVIGSGLLVPADDSLKIIDHDKLPRFVQSMLNKAPPIPKTNDPCFNTINWRIIANLQQAIAAAGETAVSLGYVTNIHAEYLQGDAIECGRHIAQVMQCHPGVLHIWGGETTMTLPIDPGKGGRCQSLALSTAIELQGNKQWCLLAAGTDGGDGVMDAAGVCIDANTLARAKQKLVSGTDPRIYLENADAGTLFEASVDLIRTGPTGTNVTDLVMGYMDR